MSDPTMFFSDLKRRRNVTFFLQYFLKNTIFLRNTTLRKFSLIHSMQSNLRLEISNVWEGRKAIVWPFFHFPVLTTSKHVFPQHFLFKSKIISGSRKTQNSFLQNLLRNPTNLHYPLMRSWTGPSVQIQMFSSHLN